VRRPGLSRLAVGTAATLAVLLLFVARPTLVAHVDLKVYDTLLRWVARSDATAGPVIVAIDDRSLEAFGRWPWPRSRLASLVEKIRAFGPAGIGLDMMFPEPDESGAPPVAQDHILAEALRRDRVVIGYAFTFEPAPGVPTDCRLPPARGAIVDRGTASPGASLFRAAGAICSLPLLAEAAAGAGFLNATPDADGIVRGIPLLVEYQGERYPSLALATLLAARGEQQVVLKRVGGRLEAVQLGDVAIPVDATGRLLLHFRDRRTGFVEVSAADVLRDRVAPGALAGRVVFVGATALGIGEFVATPLDRRFPGVGVHATAVDNITRGDGLSRPASIPAVELGLTLAAGVAAALLLAWRVSAGTLLAVTAGAIGFWLGATWWLATRGVFVSPLYPSIALSLNALASTGLTAVVERGRAHRAAERLVEAKRLSVNLLTALTEIRDMETGGHLLRTQRYTQVLGTRLARHPRFRDVLTRDAIEVMASLAPIHDIGKVGVPDHVLRKPGPLTEDELREMREHPARGREAIERALARSGIADDTVFQMAREIVYCHHERWDGTGYPRGLRGDAIPVAARIVSLADVYDALVSHRVYKGPLPHPEVVDAIVAARGTQFDPDVVDGFLEVADEWSRIAGEVSDDVDQLATPPR
jgi:HD-GYP domain-containing protein (c-di-GMP phosphodiesterase class II)